MYDRMTGCSVTTLMKIEMIQKPAPHRASS